MSAFLMDCSFSLGVDCVNTHQMRQPSNSLFVDLKSFIKP
jgi:hypothetical protein